MIKEIFLSITSFHILFLLQDTFEKTNTAEIIAKKWKKKIVPFRGEGPGRREDIIFFHDH